MSAQEIKYYGQWTPEVDRSLLETYFKDKTDGFFIEAGALDGICHSNCKMLEESFNWKGINVEPVPNFYNSLIENRPTATNINALLGNRSGEGIIEEFPNAKGLSKIVSEIKNNNCHTVRMMTYNELIKENNVTHIDLFSLDVEGSEVDVMKSMQTALVLPDIVCIEWKQIGIPTIKQYLEPLGYTFGKQFHNNITMVRHTFGE